MEAFLCEDNNDASKLMKILREQQGLRKINVVTFPKETMRRQCPPLGGEGRFYKSLVCDLYECDPLVDSFLCSKFGLDQIPILSNGADPKNMEDTRVTRYFIEKEFYSVRKV